MKKVFVFFVMFSFVFTYLGLTPAKALNIQRGTSLTVTLTDSYDSKSVEIGQKLSGRIADDIYINGKLVFKKDDSATLSVADVEKARFWGRPGHMLIMGGKARNIKGEMVRIEYHKKITGEEKTWPIVLGTISIFFLFPLALAGFVKGGQAKLPANMPIDVQIAESFSI